MKKSFHSRFRNDLFPKMPQSYADGLQRALTRAGANPRKLHLRTVLSWAAAAALLAVCALLIVFGVYARTQKRSRALASPGSFGNGASLIDTWQVTQYDYNGVLLSAQMLGGSIRYTFNEDGTAVLSQTYEEDVTLRYSIEGNTVHLERTDGQSGIKVDGPLYEGEVYDLRYDPDTDTLTSVAPAQSETETPVLSQSLAVVLMRVPKADSAVQKAVGTWVYTFGADYAQRITIRADGTATLRQTAGTLSTLDVSLTYTVSDGVLTFSGADIRFAARCNEDDTLTVAQNGEERIFTRAPLDLVGKWTLSGAEMYGNRVDADSLSGLFSIYLEFTDDGVMTLTGVSKSESIQECGHYTVNGYEITVTDENGDPLTISYDPGTDTLGMEHAYSETMGVTLVFSRTPDAVIPTSARKTAVGAWRIVKGLDFEERLTIYKDGTASVVGWRSNVELPFIYTIEDGVMQFTCVSEMTQRSFTARYDEENDVLTVTMDGSTEEWERTIPDLAGSFWTLTEMLWDDGRHASAEEAGVESTLTFQDGTMTKLWTVNANGFTSKIEYRYLTEADSVLLRANGMDINDPEVTYDPETDTLRLFTADDGRTCVYARTPDAVIPTPVPTATPVPTPTPEGEDLAKLKEQYPEYFGLDTESGLKVFVSEFACDTFSCVLVSGKDKDKTLMDVSFMHSTTVEQMKAILSTYDVAPETIEVIPYVNSLSSYWYKIDELYTSYVTFLIKGGTYIDAVQFDIDGDKLPEFCVLSYGPTSGLFTVTLSVCRDGKALCRNTFNLSYGKLRFEKTEAGLMLHHTYTEWNQSEPNEDVWLVTVDNGRIVWTNEKTGKPFTDYWGDETWNLNGTDPDTLDWSGARIGELYLCVGATAGDTVVPIPESCLDTQYGLETAETDQDAAQDCVWVKQSYLTAVPYGRSGQVWGTYAHAYGEEPPSALRWKTEQTAENGEPIVLHFAQYGEPMAFGFLEDGIADAGPRLNEPTAESLFEADWDEDGVSECIAYLKLPETGKCLISDGERTLVLEDCISVRGFYGDLDKSSPHGNLILSVEAADGIEHVYELHPEGDAIVIGAEIDGYCFVDDGMLSEDEPYDLCIGEPTPFGARGYYTVHGDALTPYTDLRVALEIFDFGVDIQRDRDWLIKDGLLLKLKRDLPCTINGEEAVIEAGTYVYLVNYRAGYQEAKLKTEDGRAFKVTMNGDSDDLRIDGVPVSDYFDNAPQG